MDLFGVFGDTWIYTLGPKRFGRRDRHYPPPPPGGPSAPTRAVAILLGAFAVPGLLLCWGGIALMTKTNDMLAPVIGIIGVVVLGVGLMIVLHAAFAATSLWQRKPGAWVMGQIYGGILVLVGVLLLFMGIAAPLMALTGLLLLAVGSAVLVLLTRPEVRADFPAPVAREQMSGQLPG